jgi:hypothetical protein
MLPEYPTNTLPTDPPPRNVIKLTLQVEWEQSIFFKDVEGMQ